ncbi:MAG: alpha/beta fold hydrolase [Planctomycetaceae bacterium]|nr:alpha/beta fold hydrolase [Planctomycetaceae bacterium]
MKTLGGRQFWGDVAWYQGWRVQHNVVFGQYRLIDPDDHRQFSGTHAECMNKLEELKKEKKLPPLSGKVVIVIHGIVRSSKSFKPLVPKLNEAGYQVVHFDYPSTQVSIPDCADYLHQVITSLEGVEEINFVVHSMGGLVVRSYLQKYEDKRLHRMVMMGVPNFGAEMADFFQSLRLFKLIYGPAGQQLVTDQKALIANLPTPDFEFGIIAGGLQNETGFNPLLPGDNDGTVTTTSTRLPGASDFVIVKCMHSLLPLNDEAGNHALRFIETGSLHTDGKKHPVPHSKAGEETGVVESSKLQSSESTN